MYQLYRILWLNNSATEGLQLGFILSWISVHLFKHHANVVHSISKHLLFAYHESDIT